MNEYSKVLRGNIISMFNQANHQVEVYKFIFNGNIDKLNDEIGSLLTQLDAQTKEYEVIKTRVDENKEVANWVENKEEQIRKLLTF